MTDRQGIAATTGRRDLLKLLAGGAIAAPLFGTPATAQPAERTAVDADRAGIEVRAAYERYRSLQEGANADYIPALATMPSALFGISLARTEGVIVSAGDADARFSIQSISKVFNLALVIQESGVDRVEGSVGVNATGAVFNSIQAIEQHRGHQMNPFVNPGAIATVGLIRGDGADAVWDKMLRMMSAFAGRPLSVDAEVYRSESETNQRNRAIAMLMAAYDVFEGDPAQAVDLYTRGCSVAVTSRDLAVMAATLAAGGRNPLTGQQVIDARHVPGILAVMATAGLYETSGTWLFNTGLPAKSGVGGGMMAVSPGKFGIGTFSPPLDASGNSVRGQRAITDISNALGGNPYAAF